MSKKTWNVDPTVTPIRDQAAARGEPMPFGKTAAELLAMGYDVRADAPPFAILFEAASSPTGAFMAVPLAKFQEVLDAGRAELDEELTVRGNEVGEETFGRDAIMTASWIRKMNLMLINPIVPGWATVRTLDVEKDCVVSLMWDRIPAQAPTDLDFEEETARRVTLGLKPLEDWRRPNKHEFRIATHLWMAKAVEQGVAAGEIEGKMAEIKASLLPKLDITCDHNGGAEYHCDDCGPPKEP
jgi:hypothetical protein